MKCIILHCMWLVVVANFKKSFSCSNHAHDFLCWGVGRTRGTNVDCLSHKVHHNTISFGLLNIFCDYKHITWGSHLEPSKISIHKILLLFSLFHHLKAFFFSFLFSLSLFLSISKFIPILRYVIKTHILQKEQKNEIMYFFFSL